MSFETVTGEEVNALIRGESLDRASVTDLLDQAATEDGVEMARPVKTEPAPDADIDPGTLPQPG